MEGKAGRARGATRLPVGQSKPAADEARRSDSELANLAIQCGEAGIALTDGETSRTITRSAGLPAANSSAEARRLARLEPPRVAPVRKMWPAKLVANVQKLPRDNPLTGEQRLSRKVAKRRPKD